MTERDLNDEWARTQLEAWVDGSLEGESRARMAAAMQRALRALPREPVPRGLRRRLLAISRRSAGARRSFLLPAMASAAAAAVAVVAVAVWLRPDTPAPLDERAAAIQEFETAMRYLQKSARTTQGRVTSAVGVGLRDAFAATRQALEQDTEETGG